MTARSWDPIGSTDVYRGDARDSDFEAGELWPGERIGSPLPAKRRKRLRYATVVVLAALGGGWSVYGEPIAWPSWGNIDTAALFASLNRTAPIASAPPVQAAAVPELPPIAVAETRTTALDMAPGVPMPQPAPAETKEADELLPPTETAKSDPLEPLPPPTVDPNDTYQVRAVSVGLHPGLSSVLLAKLSAADYRNAGIAIRTALVETADDAALIYPEQRKADLAQFKVRFVRGAGGTCRRYVVAISKEGWLTTALPMEKCGVQVVKKVARSAAPAQAIDINRRSP